MRKLDCVNLKIKIDSNQDIDDVYFKENGIKAEVVGYTYIKNEGISEVLCKVKIKYPVRTDRDEREWEEREEIKSFHHMQVYVKRKLSDKYKEEIEKMVYNNFSLNKFSEIELLDELNEFLNKVQNDYNISVDYWEIYGDE